jgi:uncharacterized protein (TIGR02246 family)
MLRRKVVLSLCAFIATACAPKPAPAPEHDPAADRAAVAAIREGYSAAFKAGDAAKVGSYFTSDAADMENGMPTMTGSTAVAEGLKAMMSEMAAQEIVITPEKTEVVGDLAYDRGTFKSTMTPKAAGAKPVVDEGRYLVVLRRQTDHSWKIVEVIGNSPVPMVPAPPAKK